MKHFEMIKAIKEHIELSLSELVEAGILTKDRGMRTLIPLKWYKVF